MGNQFNDIKSILKDLGLPVTNEKYTTLLDLLDKAEKDSSHSRSGLLLDTCDRIRRNINLLERMSDSTSQDLNTNGIVHSKKIKLFLHGGFSSGKTTFISRLLGKFVGVISPFPQTSSIVRHFGSSSRIREIMPSKTYKPPTDLKFDFTKLVSKFDLDQSFTHHGDSWTVEDESISINKWDDGRIADFVGAIDKYPGFIQRVDWGHKISDKPSKRSLLDYADIYDVPGSGGEVEHDRVIDAAVGGSPPDIIVYLIDPSRGVPARSEESTLINIALKNSEALFFWCYQKSIENKIDKFVEDQGRELDEFVLQMIKRIKVGSIDPSIIDAVRKFFEPDMVIDATGDVDDYLGAFDKVTRIISRFYLKKTRRYVDSRRSKLKAIPQLPKILETVTPEVLLREKLSALGSRRDVTIEDLNVLLNELFEKDLLVDYLKTHSDSKLVLFMIDKVNAAIGLIVSKSSKDSNNRIISVLLSRFQKQNNTEAVLDLNFLGREFELLYDHKLRVDIPLLQAYILYMLFLGKKLAPIYTKSIESHIIEQVDFDLAHLKTDLSV